MLNGWVEVEAGKAQETGGPPQIDIKNGNIYGMIGLMPMCVLKFIPGTGGHPGDEDPNRFKLPEQIACVAQIK
jgi:hypothetical protein